MNIYKILFFLAVPLFTTNALSAQSEVAISGIAKAAPAIFSLKVKNIGLNQTNAPCKPQEKFYAATSPNTSAMIVLECLVESQSDVIKISFSSDGKSVIRVLRTQYLKYEDPETVDFLKAAVKFYRHPGKIDEKNAFINYGNAYSVSYTSNHDPIISKNEAGIGLLIKAAPCGDGTFGTEDCKGKGARLIRYDLVDMPAIKKAYENGQQKYIMTNQRKLLNQKF